jgi:hypothetical protein
MKAGKRTYPNLRETPALRSYRCGIEDLGRGNDANRVVLEPQWQRSDLPVFLEKLFRLFGVVADR